MPDDQTMRALCLTCLLPLSLLGQDLRVAGVVRNGPPPYAESDRLYRIEGEAAGRLKVGQQLVLRRPDSGQKPGTLVVVQVFEGHALARMATKGDTYPLKGDLVLPEGGIAAPQSPSSAPGALRPAPQVAQPAVPVGQVLFLAGSSVLSAGGKQKLQQWVAQHGTSRVWVMEPLLLGNEPAPVAVARFSEVRAELARLGVTKIEEKPGQGKAQGEFPAIQLSLAAVEIPVEAPPPPEPPRPVPAPPPVRAAATAAPPVPPPPQRHFPPGRWEFGLGAMATTFDARYAVTDGAFSTDLDAGRDLRLNRVRIGPGLFIDYQGPRFLLRLEAYGTSNQRGFLLERQVNVDTTTYHPGTAIATELAFRNVELGWTIKLLRGSRAYLGVDLGVNAWSLKGKVEGQGTRQDDPFRERLYATTTATGTLPLPQLGFSFGWTVTPGLDLRGHIHALGWKGASYRRYGLDVRYFPLKHFGLRLTAEQESLDAPLGSVSDAMEFHGEKGVVGLGAVVRY